MESKAVSKKQLVSEFGISYIKFRRIFNEYVITNIIGYDYQEFMKIRLLPTFLADNLRLYFRNGDTYSPKINSIHVNIETGEKWVIENVNSFKKTIDLIALNNIGIVTSKRIVNLSIKEFRMNYKENVIYISEN